MIGSLSRPRLARLGLVASVALVLVVGFAAGLGFTAVRANGNGDVEACVNRYTGAVRMNSGAAPLNCTSGEFKRAWDGTDNSGVDEFYLATSSMSFNDVSIGYGTECPANYYVVAGGAEVDAPGYFLTNSKPDFANNQWIASAATPGVSQPVTMTVYAVCAHFGG